MVNTVAGKTMVARGEYIQIAIAYAQAKQPVPQSVFDAVMQRSKNAMMRRGVPDFVIDRMVLEWKGGACPECGVHYREIEPSEIVVIGEAARGYAYYAPGCECMDKKAYGDELIRVYRSLSIPREFWGANFSDWDSGSNYDSLTSVYEYAKSDSDSKPRGVVLYGEPGTGKTRAAFSLMMYMHEHNCTCVYVPVVDLIKREFGGEKGESYIDDVLKFDFLLLDDMDKIGTANEWVQNQIFGMVDRIYREQKWFCITTNAGKKEFCAPFLSATADRIASMMWVGFSGLSYRTRKQLYTGGNV